MKKIDLGQAISVLANVGVIAGIVFLAVQLQQNNKLLNAEAIGTVLEGRLDRQNLVLSGVDVASLMQRNATQESLSPEDMTRMNALRSHSLISWQRDYFSYQAGILPEQYFRANFPVMKRAIFGESGVISGSDHWETWSASAGAPDFAEFVEQCIRLDCEAILANRASFPGTTGTGRKRRSRIAPNVPFGAYSLKGTYRPEADVPV